MIRKVAIGLAIVLLALMLSFAFLVWYRSWTPLFDDGPFHGTPLAGCPEREPDQTLVLENGLVLAVFDPGADDASPIVALADSSHNTRWCVHADAYENTRVSRIRFHDQLEIPFGRVRVRGVVEWTYGREATWWFLDRDGDLLEYWYSW